MVFTIVYGLAFVDFVVKQQQLKQQLDITITANFNAFVEAVTATHKKAGLKSWTTIGWASIAEGCFVKTNQATAAEQEDARAVVMRINFGCSYSLK